MCDCMRRSAMVYEAAAFLGRDSQALDSAASDIGAGRAKQENFLSIRAD